MKFDAKLNNLARKLGVKVKGMPKIYTPTYVLGNRNGQSITVSDMLKAIEYAIQFIKANFNVNQEKYGAALKVFKIAELRFRNKQGRNPNKKELHFWVDVIHEIEDMRAKNDVGKKENEKIALALNLLIDMTIEER